METAEKTPADVMGAGEYDGIRIAAIGEDGDVLVAFGHYDPVAVATAMTKLGQGDFGWGGDVVEPDEIEERWGHLMTDCEKCNGNPDCEQCAYIRSYDGGWMFYGDDAAGPGRFPIMVADFR